ncbi:entry exclusion lipoprotein TrbK [Xanthomonas cucurbitae]|uniref:Entry exclusion lipoprotein TrbK n=1 Tax=Xanthomonas cucurbitae TaxID=56453 RepID=A0A2S7DT62_9XANT|nr:entry exclusion lipoprotein TrbK [Xanthomonas cucurbitae]
MLATSLVGCDERRVQQPAAQAELEVNDENCKSESVARIDDKQKQQAFADRCFRRGEFKPSTKKEW